MQLAKIGSIFRLDKRLFQLAKKACIAFVEEKNKKGKEELDKNGEIKFKFRTESHSVDEAASDSSLLLTDSHILYLAGKNTTETDKFVMTARYEFLNPNGGLRLTATDMEKSLKDYFSNYYAKHSEEQKLTSLEKFVKKRTPNMIDELSRFVDSKPLGENEVRFLAETWEDYFMIPKNALKGIILSQNFKEVFDKTSIKIVKKSNEDQVTPTAAGASQNEMDTMVSMQEFLLSKFPDVKLFFMDPHETHTELAQVISSGLTTAELIDLDTNKFVMKSVQDVYPSKADYDKRISFKNNLDVELNLEELNAESSAYKADLINKFCNDSSLKINEYTSIGLKSNFDLKFFDNLYSNSNNTLHVAHVPDVYEFSFESLAENQEAVLSITDRRGRVKTLKNYPKALKIKGLNSNSWVYITDLVDNPSATEFVIAPSSKSKISIGNLQTCGDYANVRFVIRLTK